MTNAKERSEEPLYEIGLAGGAGRFPDYPGSDQSRLRGLVLPYFVYRGSIFRSDDREGTRARILRNGFIDIDFSAAGSFPANSNDNKARTGMPDLDWLGEFGPRLELRLLNLANGGHLRFQLPVRAVFSTNFSNFSHRGFNVVPGLALNLHDAPFEGWKAYLKVQCSFIDEHLARYFYEVEPLYALPERPAYGVRGGYLQTEYMLGFGIPIHRRMKAYTGLWASNVSGSANFDSPLMKSSWNHSWVVGLTYLFYESDERGEL